MTQTFWDKRIPTLLGLLLIVFGVGLSTFLVSTQTNLFTRAAPPQTPERIRVTNITDSSFTVTYTTQASVIGSVSLGNSTNGQIFLDDRDQASGTPTLHTVHSITLHSLHPQTKYMFSINSGSTTYLNNGKQFTTTTGNTISASPLTQDPIAGKILGQQEAIAYVTTNNGQTLSTLTKPSGIYVIPLNTLRNSMATDYLLLNTATKLQMLITSNMQTSKILLLSDNRNPVPAITLSNDYDFTSNTTPIASPSALPVGFPNFALDSTASATPQIQTPVKDEHFVDAQPVFRGQASANSTVIITIHSVEKITTTVVTDTTGSWTYRPQQALSPGDHTITITAKDATGILHTITQSFTILMKGTEIAEAATPSATLTPPSPTPRTSSVSPTPIKSAPTPTNKPTPTLSVVSTTVPTILPTPTVILLQSNTPLPAKTNLPPTGPENITTLGFVGISTTLVGIILFIATRTAVL